MHESYLETWVLGSVRSQQKFSPISFSLNWSNVKLGLDHGTILFDICYLSMIKAVSICHWIFLSLDVDEFRIAPF